MVESKLAWIVAGAGYGINILVLAIIAGIVWGLSRLLKSGKKN